MLNVLIVEDEELIRRGLIESIGWQELGMRLEAEAANGIVALEILRTHTIDLVITDMRMPVCDGEELLRAMESEGFDCEIIVLSEYSDFSYMRQALNAHVFDYLLKPITPELLNQMLAKAAQQLRQKRVQRPECSDPLTMLLYQAMEGQTENQTENPLWACTADGTKHRFLLGVLAFPSLPEGSERMKKSACPAPCAWAICPMHRELLGMLILLPDSVAMENEVKAWIERLPDCVPEGDRRDCRIGVSRIVEAPEQTRSAYQDAVTALQFLHRNGRAVIAYEQIERLPFSDNPLCITEQQLASLLKSQEGSVKLRQSLARCLFPREYVSLSSVKRMLVQFCFLLDRCFQKTEGTKSIGVLLQEDPMSLVNQVCSLATVNQLIDRLINLAFANFSSPQDLSTEGMVRVILEKIKTNYMDDLSLMNYANCFHINYIYLSRKFKEIAGKNFSDLLVQVRMEHAVTLIQRDGYSEKETAALVGYSNAYYFASCYQKYSERKKAEGVTAIEQENDTMPDN